MPKEPMSFAAAMKDYFGTRTTGEGAAKSFMDEWKELSDADKAYFREELMKIGYTFK
jgi:hypothetical protein